MKVIAEIGTCWVPGDKATLPDLLESIKVASQTGAHGVKLQIKLDGLYSYTRAPKIAKSLEKYSIPPRWIEAARSKADELGIELWASMFSIEAVKNYSRYLSGIKVASGDLVWKSMLTRCAEQAEKLSLPLCVSVGAATPDEIDSAIEVLEKYDLPTLIMLHCVSDYPADEERVDLLAGVTNLVANHTGIVDEIGFSDHTKGSFAGQIAIGAGYTVFEKHLNPFGSQSAPDAKVALSAQEFTRYIEDLRRAEMVLGKAVHRLTTNEVNERSWARRGSDTFRPVDNVKEK